ncbi:Cu-Zn family superoxide dismutase [Crossiella equi]|uniref:Cu-Zn family superoxide dismutase n=1 Tax=Crossiella equi TaxID=130796 RepID=A0ABS5A6Q2_9PSEU|nr:superoxide dismutase family protein [Crossiella equi]MBP2472275.1 Cu-Zn family superoxide dismutase [Crossiella equi]
MRVTATAVLSTVVLASGLAACGGGGGSAGSTSPSATSASAAPGTGAKAVLAAPAASGDQPVGITYDPARVPAGGTLAVSSTKAGEQTTVTLTVTGLLPGTMYGAHVHTKKCGAKAADSGPHYQDQQDPVTPSVDPRYANAQNEIWLDFHTDGSGNASASSTVKWAFRSGGANSVVVHASHTSTEPGKAGTAGDRLACLSTAF